MKEDQWTSTFYLDERVMDVDPHGGEAGEGRAQIVESI
jgi:hypothetical protein